MWVLLWLKQNLTGQDAPLVVKLLYLLGNLLVFAAEAVEGFAVLFFSGGLQLVTDGGQAGLTPLSDMAET